MEGRAEYELSQSDARHAAAAASAASAASAAAASAADASAVSASADAWDDDMVATAKGVRRSASSRPMAPSSGATT